MDRDESKRYRCFYCGKGSVDKLPGKCSWCRASLTLEVIARKDRTYAYDRALAEALASNAQSYMALAVPTNPTKGSK